MTIRTTCIATLLFATNVFAAAATDPAKVVGPYLDDQVVAVIRVDATRVDAKALQAWLVERMNAQAAKVGPADAERIRAAANDLGRPRAEMEKFFADFRAAGGREMYVPLGMNDVMQQRPPVLIIPIEAGADVSKLEAMFAHEGPAAPKFTERVGDALLAGEEAQRQPLRQAHENKGKTSNAELLAALAAMNAGVDANDAPAVQVAIAPSAESRKAFEQLAPMLPKELGGGTTSDLTQGMRWATIAIALPPKPSVRVVVQARDAAAVDALDKTIHAAVDAGTKAAEAEAARHKGRADAAVLDEAAKLLPGLIPAREGNNRLVLSMNDAKLADLTGVISSSLLVARGNAQRAQSMSNIRQLLLACVLWANDHKNEWPDDLAAAAKAYDAGPVLANPRGGKSAYKYVKPPKDTKASNERIVIYETDALDPNGLDVGFMDGHVEFMNDQQFQKQFKAQGDKGKPAPGAE